MTNAAKRETPAVDFQRDTGGERADDCGACDGSPRGEALELRRVNDGITSRTHRADASRQRANTVNDRALRDLRRHGMHAAQFD